MSSLIGIKKLSMSINVFVKMKRELELEILSFVHQNWSYWAIKNYYKCQKVIIHDAQIARIKKKYSLDKENQPPSNHIPKKTGRPLKLTPSQISNLKKVS